MRLIIQKGFTLIEIILLIVIMGIMFTVAMKSMQPSIERARETATLEEMELLAKAIIGNDNLIEDGIRSDYGYVGDIGSLPSTLDDLITRPAGYSTWNGPYLSAGFSENPDYYKNDAWNQPYIYSGGVTIASAGGGATITKKLADYVSELTANSLSGNIYDGLGYPPGDSASGIGITIYFPDGAGGNTSTTTSPNAAGYFTFLSVVPIGNHLIRAIYGATNDTTSAYVSIPPASSPYCELRFQADYWAPGGPGSGGGLEYVSGSALAYGSGSNTNNIEFQITNSSAVDTFTISWLIADFSTSPASYYGYISWDGVDIWSGNPYNGPGDMALFTPQELVPGQTVVIRIREFRRNQNGSGQKVNMNGVAFTIMFSTGNVIDIVVP